jgi:hypothetical protein
VIKKTFNTLVALGDVTLNDLSQHAFIPIGNSTYRCMGQELGKHNLLRGRSRICPACFRRDTGTELTPDTALGAYGRILWAFALDQNSGEGTQPVSEATTPILTGAGIITETSWPDFEVLFSAINAQEVLEQPSGAVTFSAAQKRLGMTRSQMVALIRAGILKPGEGGEGPDQDSRKQQSNIGWPTLRRSLRLPIRCRGSASLRPRESMEHPRIV